MSATKQTLPKGWRLLRLGDQFEIYKGRKLNNINYAPQKGDTRYIQIDDLRNDLKDRLLDIRIQEIDNCLHDRIVWISEEVNQRIEHFRLDNLDELFNTIDSEAERCMNGGGNELDELQYNL